MWMSRYICNALTFEYVQQCSTKLIVYMPVKKPGHMWRTAGQLLVEQFLTDPHDIGSHCLKA